MSGEGLTLRFIAAKSRKLKSYETRYHLSKGELLALVFGLQKFSYLLAGQHFTVRTDNLSVKYWQLASLAANPILACWLDFLADFRFDCVHVAGKQMIPADTLSRLLSPNDEGEGEETERGGEVAQVYEGEGVPGSLLDPQLEFPDEEGGPPDIP